MADYIQDAGSREHWTVAEKAGWHSGAYILPNGEVLNTSEETRLFYNGDKSQATAYAVSGSLKDWQENVDQICQRKQPPMFGFRDCLCRTAITLTKNRKRRLSLTK